MPLNVPNADRIRLLHMFEAARQARQFCVGRDRQSLDADAMFRRALINCVPEIGEAAVRVTDGTRAQIPGVPWQQIVGMRNRLVHVYFHIDPDIVWGVLETDLPSLIASLEPIIQATADSKQP